MLDILLRDLSNWTFDRLTGAHQAGFEMREESITENLLVDLHRHPSVDTRIYKTSATGQEPEYGPDWLWSIFINGLGLTMWVQAKKATGEAYLRYDGLEGDHAKRQALRLLLNARAQDAVPIYAFFNRETAPFIGQDPVPLGGCARHQVTVCPEGLPWSEEHHPDGCSQCGVTIADGVLVANAIFADDATKRHASYINSFALPWECLVCPNRPPPPEDPAPGPPDDGDTLHLPRLPDLLTRFAALVRQPGVVSASSLPLGLTMSEPEWVVRLREQGNPFRESIAPDDDLSLPEFFVASVIRQ